MFKIKYISKENNKVVYDNTVMIDKINEYLYRNDVDRCYITINDDVTIDEHVLNGGYSEVIVYTDGDNGKSFKLPDSDDDYPKFLHAAEKVIEYCYSVMP